MMENAQIMCFHWTSKPVTLVIQNIVNHMQLEYTILINLNECFDGELNNSQLAIYDSSI